MLQGAPPISLPTGIYFPIQIVSISKELGIKEISVRGTKCTEGWRGEESDNLKN